MNILGLITSSTVAESENGFVVVALSASSPNTVSDILKVTYFDMISETDAVSLTSLIIIDMMKSSI